MSYETKYIAGLESLVQEYAHRLARAETDVAGAAALADVLGGLVEAVIGAIFDLARGEWVAENDRLVVENDAMKAANAKLAAELSATVTLFAQLAREREALCSANAELSAAARVWEQAELWWRQASDPDKVCVEVSDVG